ncbi:unnamed protein product [Dracunculus medinensis]|uniref:Acyl_transf_3 domain-containing protein n=1 Tax=Dracunculus medinensis TaxID=318479 RepID=A0A158Q5M2_DRAME|nr:unnamed protein product [Dracunculus medinensis]
MAVEIKSAAVILGCLLYHIVTTENLRIQQLFANLSEHHLTDSCKNSLRKIEYYFASKRDEKLYYDSFGSGKTNELVSNDRFVTRSINLSFKFHRMLKCFKASGDTEFSISDYHLLYCYGSDTNNGNKDINTYDICVPTICVTDHLKILNEWKTFLSNDSTSDIREATCVPSRREKQWFQQFLPIISFFYILLSLKYRIFLAFSAKKNINKLFELPKDCCSVISCMFGIRFLAIIWIIIGHTFAWIQPYLLNVDEFKQSIAQNFLNQWITNFLLTVDIFLVLGGTVNAYGWFNRMTKPDNRNRIGTLSFWIAFYRHRLVRLWPAYIYTLFGVLFLSNIHFHAMWPEIDPALLCPKYWWQNLLYISTEFIYYAISPIFLIILLWSRKFGTTFIIACIAISAILRAFAMEMYNLPPTQLGWTTPPIYNKSFMEHYSQMYIKPQFRIGPYLIGLLLGYHLSQFHGKATNQSTKFIITGWITSGSLIFFSIYGLYPISMRWNWPLYYLLYGAIHRTTFAVGMAWIIFVCHTGKAEFINSFFSLKIFLPLSSLSYSVYLSHMPVIFGSFMQMTFPIIFSSNIILICHCLMSLILSYILGLQCSLLSEFPAMNIEKILFQPSRNDAKIYEDHPLSIKPQ